MRRFAGVWVLGAASLLACSHRPAPSLGVQRDGRPEETTTENGSSAEDAATAGASATQPSSAVSDDSVPEQASSGGGETDVAVIPVEPKPPAPRDGFDCSPREDYDVSLERAVRALARVLWGSEPDAELLAMVESDALATPSRVQTLAERMVTDARAVRRLGAFTQWWLEMQYYSSEGFVEAKAQYDSAYTPEAYRATMEETRLFTEDLLSNHDATLSDFLTSRRSFVNADLAPYYGLEVGSSEFTAVELPAQRSGVLTQLQFLGRGQLSRTNPPLRGYFTLEKLLCIDVGVPSPELTPPPEIQPGMTTRQFFEAYYSDLSCKTCHDYGVVLGYAFENFDAFGRLRTEEQGTPIDTSTFVKVLEGEPAFPDAPSLLRDLAKREVVHECMTKHWLAFLLNRDSANGYSAFSQFELNSATCPSGSSGSGSGVPCLPAVTLSDRVVDESECSRYRGELYLLDLILSVATSKLLIEGSFECGPLTCLQGWEYCYRVREANSDVAVSGADAGSISDMGGVSNTEADTEVAYRYGCEQLRDGCKDREGCTCTTEPDGATTMTCE